MLGASAVRMRVAAAFALAVIFLVTFAHCSNNNSKELSSRTCVAENCNSVGFRYGKYCGVGWTGCPEEKPCDDVDACCKIHDDCVGNTGNESVEVEDLTNDNFGLTLHVKWKKEASFEKNMY